MKFSSENAIQLFSSEPHSKALYCEDFARSILKKHLATIKVSHESRHKPSVQSIENLFFKIRALGERLRGNRHRGNSPERFWGL